MLWPCSSEIDDGFSLAGQYAGRVPNTDVYDLKDCCKETVRHSILLLWQVNEQLGIRQPQTANSRISQLTDWSTCRCHSKLYIRYMLLENKKMFVDMY